MTRVTILPSPLNGAFTLPPSKSHLQRVLILSAITGGTARLGTDGILCDDIEATMRCLSSLGAVFERQGRVIRAAKTLTVDDLPHGAVLPCGESGATARFLLPLAAMFADNAVLTGEGSLNTRPMDDICVSLAAHGAVLSDKHLPIRITTRADRKGVFRVAGNISSQFLSGLLITLPLTENASVVCDTALKSADYVKMTCGVMRRFGADVTENGGCYTASHGYSSPTSPILIDSDFSGGAFFFGAVSDGCTVTAHGHTSCDLPRGDRRMLDILRAMGDTVTETTDSVSVSGNGTRHGVRIDVSDCPDLVPILAVIAAAARGKTVLQGTDRLRFKESDRVNSVCGMISSLGGHIYTEADSLIIHGDGSLRGGKVDCRGDHRIAMAGAAAAVFCRENVVLDNADCVNKSYPSFFDDLCRLNGRVIKEPQTERNRT